IPKPMVTIGYRPILWHVMKYYAYFGHKDFVVCLGYRGDAIKNYFLNYSECLSNDFVLSEGGKKLELMGSDIHDWKITFVDTGATSNIGQRLKAVERYVRDEPEFLANYSDGLTNLPLPAQLEHFRKHDAIASFISVKPQISYHPVSTLHGGSGIARRRRTPSPGSAPRSESHFRRHASSQRARVASPTASMRTLTFREDDAPFRILCIGAHSDDIEIGCGGSILD